MTLPCDLPFVQAPMAGGPSTPELAAAVATAGGFGFVAAGYLSPTALHDAIAATRAMTDRPFGVNLFVPSRPSEPEPIARYAAKLRPEAERLGVTLGEPRWDDDGYAAKLELVAAERPHLVTFTFGCPSEDDVARLHAAGVQVGVTVTGADEARIVAGAGADLLVVQGTEAGGHQGGVDDTTANTTPLLDALREIAAVTDLPLIGSGGVMAQPACAQCSTRAPTRAPAVRRCCARPRPGPPTCTATRC
jgi:nitronate monooxygenase